jgi:membrane-associated phospholipid phosphatase
MIERAVPLPPVDEDRANRAGESAPRFAFEPVDALVAAFAGGLTLLGLLRWNAMPEHAILLRLAIIALVPLIAGHVRARRPRPGSGADVFCDFYPVAAVVAIFDSLGPLIRAVNPVDKDRLLIALDRWIFGFDPTVRLEPYATPFLSDVLTVCYALYYFHPIILGAFIYRDDRLRGAVGRAREFRTFAFTMVAVFFVSYAGYFIVPAVGPRFTITHAGPLARGRISAAIDRTLDELETNKRDCFPSGHTMVVTAVLIEGARRSRRTFLAFLPLAIGLVLATVYCRYHYVVDVIAGFALAFVVVPLARALVRRAPADQVARPTIR